MSRPALRGALVVAWRDYRSAFATPKMSVLIAAFLFVTGLVFAHWLAVFSDTSEQVRMQAVLEPSILEHFSVDVAVVGPTLRFISLLLILLVPLLTMQLIAEEKRAGTLELLLTAPISPLALVLGKFLGGLALAATPVMLTLWQPLALALVASPDLGPLAAGYVGLLLVTAVYTAVGMLASTLTKSPLLAAFLASCALVFSLIAGALGDAMSTNLGSVLSWLSIIRHFDRLASGVVDTGDLAFFGCVTAGLLFLAHRVLESYRWR